jgi:SAM-dependent MidA family methyltransferase
VNELTGILAAEIAASGPISFARFMELALYHPTLGYYRRERPGPRTGRAGDFFTSVSVGPLFGRLLARQFFEMWELLEKPDPFWIIEQGAEDGQLAADILDWSRAQVPDFFAAIHYALIEPAPDARALQQKKLGELGLAGKVLWDDLADLAARQPVGVIFCNELVDAFPVRLITRQQDAWVERCVTFSSETEFTWTHCPIEDAELANTITSLPLPPLPGYTTEIHLRARHWMRETAAVLARGYALTLDYGFPASGYYADFRSHGTLTAYRAHRRSDDVLRDPGAQDITAHVEFTGLIDAAARAGLAPLGLLDQQHFLMGIAHAELSGSPAPSTGLAENLRAWQTLIHPSHLGTRFHALLQAKHAPAHLAGLRFAPAAPT